MRRAGFWLVGNASRGSSLVGAWQAAGDRRPRARQERDNGERQGGRDPAASGRAARSTRSTRFVAFNADAY